MELNVCVKSVWPQETPVQDFKWMFIWHFISSFGQCVTNSSPVININNVLMEPAPLRALTEGQSCLLNLMNMPGISTFWGENIKVHLIKDSSKYSQTTIHHHKHRCDKEKTQSLHNSLFLNHIFYCYYTINCQLWVGCSVGKLQWI